MPEQYEVRVIFECPREVLDRIGHHEDEQIRRQQRELGLINAQDELTIFGLYVSEERQRFFSEQEKREAKRKQAAKARDREAKALRRPQKKSAWEEERERWVQLRDAAPDRDMSRREMADYCGVTENAVYSWVRHCIITGDMKNAREVIDRYIAHRDVTSKKKRGMRRAWSGKEIRLSDRDERELVEILAETGV